MMNPKRRTLPRVVALVFSVILGSACAQTAPQHLAFAGLRTASSQGQFNAIQADASGNLYLLLDQHDGIRLLKTDPTATNILAEAHLGAQGDVGLALVLDPAGNPYVAGTTTSTTLTGTPNSAFPTRADASTNSFLARFDSSLNTVFLTFAGSGHLTATALAVTADAAFLTGSLFAATLPTTPNAFEPTPAQGSAQNGFVERFSSDGATLVYATYLTGPAGNTAPAAIAADSSDNTYIAGYTTSVAYPTKSGLIPTSTTPAGFLTSLTPAGDALTVSTYLPGNGITSLVLDPATQTLLLTGNISLSHFPIATVQTPLVNTSYQSLLRLPLDASSVIASALLAPGTQSVVTPGPNSTAWVAGTLTTPLLPIPPLSTTGTAFAAHVTAQATIDQTARFGALPANNPNNSSAPITLTSLALDSTGQPYLAGSFTPTTSSDLLATEQYDLSLTDPQPPLLPSSVSDSALSPGTCQGSLCTGSAAYLAQLSTTAAPTLALSLGALSNITLRNLGSLAATNVHFATTGYTLDSNCPGSLAPGAECALSLTGPGPGVLTALADNAPTQTVFPGVVPTPTPIVFSPHELDFGVQTATSAPILRTLTITNLSSTSQTFTSALDSTSTTSPFSESSSDCPSPNALTDKLLSPDATCHITFALALNSSIPDGPITANWTIAASGHHDVLFTGFAQSAALTPSAGTIDFGARYPATPPTSRYLYLSNNSDASIPHAPAAVPTPFTLTDLCPATLLPHSVCQIQLDYAPVATPSSDTTTLPLDQGISVLVTGQTVPQSNSNTPPSLTASPTTVTFANPIPVTTTSSPQSVTLTNTGTTPYPITAAVTGDFTDTTTCPGALPPEATCTVNLTFSPTTPGTRSGLLTIDSAPGAASSPAPIYIGLTATASPILQTSGEAISFGALSITESAVQWLKITSSFQTLTAATSAPYQAIFVEDTGYGHGSPAPSAFSTTASGTCFNCYLGLRFSPTTTGPQPGTLTLSSTGSPYTVPMTGTGIPLTGLIATPATQDFGHIPVNSTSPPALIALTNLTQASVTLTPLTITPGFAISAAPTGGAACSGTLAPSATCFTNVVFSPTATGSITGTLTFQSSTETAAVPLTGTGSPDPGLSLNPTALTFQNLPGPTATQQSITLTNTGPSPLTIGTPTATTANFAATTTCSALAPAATCTINVTYISSSAAATANLQIPVTTAAGSSTYNVPLTGAYDSQNAGLQLLPAAIDFGPTPTSAVAGTRAVTLNNLTANTVSVALTVPAQFAITGGDPCITLAPNASCTFSVASIPLTTGDPTGTLFATSIPTDGTSPTSTLVYLESYGLAPGASTLAITGPLTPGTGLLDFGQLNPGQTSSRTLTLTNQSSTQSITVRRVTSQPPFLSTTTCGQTLTPTQTCTVTLTYAPFNQVVIGPPTGPPPQDIGSLTIESDAVSSPDIVPLAGRASSTPANAPSQSSYTLTQGSLTFFTTAVGDISPPQTITFTNTGNTTLHLGTLTSTPEFPVTTTCSQPIAPASTCTLSLTFIPQANGPRTAALEIATDSGVSLEPVTLYGLASPSSLLLSPLSLDFGTLLTGNSSTQAVTVTNNGLVPVTFSAITLTGDYAQTNDCPIPSSILPANATCTIQVTFTPTAAGPRPGILSVASAASTLPLTVSLDGAGSLTQPHIQITPTNLDFGSIPVAASSTKAITVTNAGTVPITVSAIAITGDYAQTSTCPTSNTALAPGASCAIQIVFTPTLAGPRPGTLNVTTSGSTVPLAVTLTGTGTASQPQLQINPTTLDFGSVQIGTPSTQPVSITNTGSVPATLSAITLTGDYTQTNTCPAPNATLPSGVTCTIQITFTPNAAGPRPGTLSIFTSATTSPLAVSLTGTGAALPTQPQLQVTPSTLQFGSIPVGSPSTQPITVTNTGAVPVTFSALTLAGDYTQTNTCSTLAPAASCLIQVTFTPTTTGSRTGALLLSSSAPTIAVPLSGTGIQSSLQITPTALNFGSIPLGSSAILPITLANTGTAPLALTLTTTGDYATTPCPATLPAAQTCIPNITFTPTVAGSRSGTFVANGTTIPLTGTGTSTTSPPTPTFTLTIENSQSAIATVTQGATATYALTATPTNNFTGTITVTCAATMPTPNVLCAVAPPSLNLNGSPQTATLTLTTLTNLNAAYLLPLLLLFRKKTRRRPRAILATVSILLLSSCGGGPEPNLRYAVPGSYTFTVTAASTTGVSITQTVTATLIITAQRQP